MSAALRTYAGLISDGPDAVFTVPTAPWPFPPRTHETTITGDYKSLRRVQVAPETGLMAWDYTEYRDFEMLALLVEPTPGYLYCWYKGDTPVSTTNLTPSGSNKRWRQFDLSCLSWSFLNTDQCRIDTASAAQDVGETGGIPTAAGSGTLALGKVYGLYVYNPHETLTASLWVGVVN